MEKIHQYLDRTADNLCQYAPLVKNPGLMNGKMGIALFLYRCGRMIDQPVCERVAGELVDDVLERLSTEDPIDFDTGLCGIGYGIDYLIKNKYVEAESEEILEGLDAHIISVTEKEESESGQLFSATKYWLKRGNHRLSDGNIARLTQSLLERIGNIEPSASDANNFICYYIFELLLVYAGIDREPQEDVRNLYEYIVKSDFMTNNLGAKWSDRYICQNIHRLFRDKEVAKPLKEDKITLTDLINFRNCHLQYGLTVPLETHSKIQNLLDEDDLLDEWIDLALPTTMHINGYMTGFGWILLDMLDARSQAQSLKP